MVLHIVNLSMWPLSIMLIMMEMFLMLMLSMKFGFLLLIMSLLFLFGLGLWFKDAMRESDLEINHGYLSNVFSKLGMISFISSEIMFFISFFWCYSDFAMAVDMELGVWPPKGMLSISPSSAPSSNTLILSSSGVFITWTHFSILSNDWFMSLVTSVSTLVSGIHPLVIQYIEYGEVPYNLMMSGYGSISPLATGFHGFHVVSGCLMIYVSRVRAMNLMLDGVSHYNFEFSAWYWHFVDAVWLFSFIFTYWWGF